MLVMMAILCMKPIQKFVIQGKKAGARENKGVQHHSKNI